MKKHFKPIKRVALAFVAVCILSPAAHAASFLVAAAAITAISGATLIGAAAVGHPIHDTLKHQAVSFRDGAERIPGKELTDVFVQMRKTPGYERASDQQLTEEVLAALSSDPIQN